MKSETWQFGPYFEFWKIQWKSNLIRALRHTCVRNSWRNRVLFAVCPRPSFLIGRGNFLHSSAFGVQMALCSPGSCDLRCNRRVYFIYFNGPLDEWVLGEVWWLSAVVGWSQIVIRSIGRGCQCGLYSRGRTEFTPNVIRLVFCGVVDENCNSTGSQDEGRWRHCSDF